MKQLIEYIKTKSLTPEILNSFLTKGIDIDKRSAGMSPLMVACQVGCIKQVKLILQHAIDIDNEKASNYSYNYSVGRKRALSIAIKTGNIEIIQVLLDHGADMQLLDETRKTPLELAIKAQNIPILMRLLKNKVKVFGRLKESMDKNPKRYDELGYANAIESEKINQSLSEIITRVKKLVANDAQLSLYPELSNLLDCIKILDSVADVSDGNSADKIEATQIKIEFSPENIYYLDYWYGFNWSYGDVWLLFTYSTDLDGHTVLLKANENKEKFTSQEINEFKYFTKNLGLEAIPLEHTMRFLIIVLSAFVQVGYIPLNEHGLYQRMFFSKDNN